MPPRGQQTSTNSRLYTITEVAEVLGINRATAYRLAREDRLPAPVIRLGRQFRVVKAPIDAVVAGRQEGAEPAPAPPQAATAEDAPADPVAVISRAVLAHAEAIEGGRASGGVGDAVMQALADAGLAIVASRGAERWALGVIRGSAQAGRSGGADRGGWSRCAPSNASSVGSPSPLALPSRSRRSSWAVSRPADSALEEWASLLGMGPDLLAWAMGAAGILCIAGGVSLLGRAGTR